MGSGVYRSAPGEVATPSQWLRLHLTVDPGSHGARLDRFLSSKIHRLSRMRVQDIIALGHVRTAAGGPLLRPSRRMRSGDVIVLHRPEPVEPPVVRDYTVLHEDDALLVLDKPAGLPVHPSARYHRNTLTALLRERLGPEHPWVMAHRLDRETSGVLLFGRRGAGSGALKRAFQERRVEKVYLALVHGTLVGARTLELPLGPALGSRIRIKVGPRPLEEGGAAARTEVVPLAHGSFRGAPITLVEARPRTGRQHQVRAHLCEIGHGVVGDKLYGIDEERFLEVVDGGRPMADLESDLGLGRHALHASRLTFPHPLGGEPVTITAPWPRELAQILEAPAP